jgi:tRNA dimethylallyltransferase
VRWLLDHNYSESLVPMKGLGYRQLARCLRGEIDFDTAVYLIKRDTRHYARRQLTWFRAEALLRWLDVAAIGGPQAAAEAICEGWGGMAG